MIRPQQSMEESYRRGGYNNRPDLLHHENSTAL